MSKMKFRPYRKYKDSSVEWIGEIPEHWNIKKIRFASYVKGRIGWQGLRADEFIDEGPYLITGMHFKDGKVDWDSCYHVSEERYNQAPEIHVRIDDLIITKDGTIGKVAYINSLPGPTSLNSHLLIIRPLKEQYITRYLFWYFQANVFDIYVNLRQTGTTFFGISQEDIESFKFACPNIENQKQISDFLDQETSQINATTEKYQKLIELLKEKRIALISHAVTKGLNPDVKMKDSGVETIGEIPIHWTIKKIKYCIADKNGAIKTGPFGSQLKSADMEDSEIKVYNQETVISKDIQLGENYVSQSKYNELKAFQVYCGDILVTTRGTIGRCLIVPDNAEKGILHPCLLRIQVNDRKILREYLSLIIEQSDFVPKQLMILSCATTIEVIYQDNMRNIEIPLPPVNEQEDILKYLDQETSKIDQLIEKINKQIEQLNEYRTSLISHAVTGKIDVR